MYWSKLLPNSTLLIVNFHEEGVNSRTHKSLVTITVYDGKILCYISSCDGLANVYLDSLVGSAHGWKAEGPGFDPGPGQKKKAFSLLLLLLYINK